MTPDGFAPRLDRVGLAWLLVAGYAGLLWAFDALPYQDVPNHLARAVVIADLLFDGGTRFGEVFAFEWRFVPYILGDAWHAVTVQWLSPEAAARVWVIVAFASFPAATALLLRTWDAPRPVLIAGVVAAAFLGADWFLRLGFLNFRYGLALALLGVVAWERLLAKPGVARAVLYAAVVVGAYLTHLTALIFTIGIVGVLSLLRLVRDREGLVRYALAGAPPLLLLGWHLVFQPGLEAGASWHPDLVSKLLQTVGGLAPTRERLELLCAAAFVGLVTVPLLASRFRGWPPRAWETFAVGLAFGILYLWLPEKRGEIWGVNIRALPMAWLFAALTAAWVVAYRGAWEHAFRIGLFGVALVHLAVLGATLREDNATMRAYREVALRVPAGATVLPVVTAPKRGLVSPTAHAASFATVHRGAIVPYTFTGNLGAPMPYFTFRERPPAFPWQWWYLHDRLPRRWVNMLSGYDYLLIQTPVDWRRLPRRVEVVEGNAAVVLARPGAVARLAEQSR